MKKIKISFSLEEYKKGGYEVEDGHGRSVRIGFTDRKGKQPILGLVDCKDGEVACNYSENGLYDIYGTHSYNDLVLIKYEFEDGDIVYAEAGPSGERLQRFIFIYGDSTRPSLCFSVIKNGEWNLYDGSNWAYHNARLATEEEKRMLFNELAAQKGLKWNAEIKDFEKIEKEPDEKNVEIKKGDLFFCVKTFHSKGESDNRFSEFRIYESPEDGYIRDNNGINRGFACSESEFNKYFEIYDWCKVVIDTLKAKELVFGTIRKDKIDAQYLKYDTKPKPKDFVLVRDNKYETWELNTFSRIADNDEFPYICIGSAYSYCIPYNSETEHLLGTTEDCPEKYKQNNE